MKPVAIEQPAKHFKAVQAAGLFGGVAGIAVMLAAVATNSAPLYFVAGACIVVLGIVVFIVGRVAAWWKHG
jgi:hypothetical protein